MPAPRKLDKDAVAAWVLKASPIVYDVEAAIADGAVPFDSWRLAPSYRIDMVAVGDPVVLWLSGYRAGIVAAGTVSGLPFVTQGGTRYWVDIKEKTKLRPYLPVELVPIPKLDKLRLMRDRRFRHSEVIRAPQMGNPSYLTGSEYSAVRQLMDSRTVRRIGWPAR